MRNEIVKTILAEWGYFYLTVGDIGKEAYDKQPKKVIRRHQSIAHAYRLADAILDVMWRY